MKMTLLCWTVSMFLLIPAQAGHCSDMCLWFDEKAENRVERLGRGPRAEVFVEIFLPPLKIGSHHN